MTWYDQNPRFLGCGYEGSKFPRKFEKIEKACKIRESWNSRVVYSVALWLALSALSPLIQRTLLLSACIGVSFNCNVPRSTRQSRLVRLKPGSRPQLIDSSPGYIVSSTEFYRSRTELIVNRTNKDCWVGLKSTMDNMYDHPSSSMRLEGVWMVIHGSSGGLCHGWLFELFEGGFPLIV